MDKEYHQLLTTYRRMFGMVDIFHFNSYNTSEVYGKFLNEIKHSKVIPITHNGIKDYRKQRIFSNDLLRIGFIGSENPYKGLPLLKTVIATLNREGYENNISLSIYGGRKGVDDFYKNIRYKGRFTSNQMKTVFDTMDLLIVPSIWYETFSLITIEALQFGIPVLVSDKVGAKDIVAKYNPLFVFHEESDLYIILKSLIEDKRTLIEYNHSILKHEWHYSLEDHAQEIVEKLYK